MKVKCTLIAMAMLAGCMLFSGCATRMYEDRARNWAVVQGLSVNEYNSKYVVAPTNNPALKSLLGGHRGMHVSDLAVQLYPVQYRIAEAVDYFVLPAAVTYGLYEAIDSINTGGSSSKEDNRSYTYTSNGGPVQVGDNNSASESDDDTSTVTTTTTTTSHEESHEDYSSYSGAE